MLLPRRGRVDVRRNRGRKARDQVDAFNFAQLEKRRTDTARRQAFDRSMDAARQATREEGLKILADAEKDDKIVRPRSDDVLLSSSSSAFDLAEAEHDEDTSFRDRLELKALRRCLDTQKPWGMQRKSFSLADLKRDIQLRADKRNDLAREDAKLSAQAQTFAKERDDFDEKQRQRTIDRRRAKMAANAAANAQTAQFILRKPRDTSYKDDSLEFTVYPFCGPPRVAPEDHWIHDQDLEKDHPAYALLRQRPGIFALRELRKSRPYTSTKRKTVAERRAEQEKDLDESAAALLGHPVLYPSLSNHLPAPQRDYRCSTAPSADFERRFHRKRIPWFDDDASWAGLAYGSPFPSS